MCNESERSVAPARGLRLAGTLSKPKSSIRKAGVYYEMSQ